MGAVRRSLSLVVVVVAVAAVASGLLGCGGGDSSPPTTPGNLKAVRETGGAIALSWAASLDDSRVAGYRISRDGTEILTATGTSIVDDAISLPSRSTR